MPPKTLQPVAGKMKKSKSTSSVPTTAAELDIAGIEEQSPPSDKLRMKEVIAACRVAVSHQQSNEDPDSEVAKALRVLQMFADLKEKEAQNAIGYSRVKREMLDDLSIKTGFLRLDKVAAKKDAARRKLPPTERFCQDKEYYRDGGLSKKEALASLSVANYLLEVLYAPQGPLYRRLLKGIKDRGGLPWLPKFSPEQTVPHSEHFTSGGRLYKFHGVIDYVTFLTDPWRTLTAHDVSEWDKMMDLSHGMCSVEVKSGHMAHEPEHVWEATAQAVSLSKHLKKPQRYVMTDGVDWRFCLFHPTQGVNYLSDILSADKEGDELILTLLEEWVWYAQEFSPSSMWSLQDQ